MPARLLLLRALLAWSCQPEVFGLHASDSDPGGAGCAVGRRLQSLMKASLPKPLNNFVRHTAVRFTSRRPVGKIRKEGMPPRDEIFVSRSFDEGVRNAHGFSPVLTRKG